MRSRAHAAVRALTLVALTGVPPCASAQTRAAHGKVAVHFVAIEGGEPWFARALAQTVDRELSRFQRVALADRIEGLHCEPSDSRCRIAAYRDAGADVVVLGMLSGTGFSYEIFETWTGARAARGSLDLGPESSGSQLQHQIGRIVRPIVESGGLLDHKPASSPPPNTAVTPSAPLPTAAPPPPAELRVPYLGVAFVPLVLACLIAFMAAPLLLALALLGRKQLAAVTRPASWSVSVAVVTFLIALLVANVVPGLVERIRSFPLPAFLSQLARLCLPLLGGALWGSFFLLNARVVLPRLHGLERIRSEALRSLLTAWIWVILLRACSMLLYLPIFVLAVRASRVAGFGAPTTWMLIVPGSGLLGYFWFLSLVDNVSLFVDQRLVVGEANERNPWHPTIKRYFMGYVRRTGLAIDRKMVDRLLFLPATCRGVVSYGGGLARPRILVGADVREVALGDLPDEIDAPERPANPDDATAGSILPNPETARSMRRTGMRTAVGFRRKAAAVATAPSLAHGPAPRLIGEHAALLGWVIPAKAEQTVPLIANTREDYDVVRELLTEHYAAFERNLYDEEVDDTDPTQKDFLFGALLRAIGGVLRRESELSALRLAFEQGSSRISAPVRLLGRIVAAFYRRFLSRHPAVVADAYPALNLGRDTFVQYLDLLRGGPESHLTTRADAPRLYATSKEIFAAVSQEVPAAEDRHLFQATLRNRLVWLSQFFYVPIPERRERRFRAVMTALLTTAVGLMIASAVRDAVRYQPVYAERTREMEARLAEAQKGSNDGGAP